MHSVEYKPEICECCGQTTTYLLPVDRGSANIVRAIAGAVRRLGRNEVHPNNEMEVFAGKGMLERDMVELGYMTSRMRVNLSRPRFHGLIAKVRGKKGYYALTAKGANFLRGERIPKYAIVSKTQGHQVGYFQPELHNVTIGELLRHDSVNWESMTFFIHNSAIVDHPARVLK